jgi:hypothetical protein
MGIRILEGSYDGESRGAAMVDSVTDTVFGPLFKSAAHIDDFLEWLKTDARRFTDVELREQHDAWHEECCDEDGELGYAQT